MRYMKYKLKFALMLIAAISFGFCLNAYALQKIEIIPANYDAGAPAKTLSNNTGVSMTANKQVGYQVDFSDSPSLLNMKLGSSANSQSTLEIRVDDAASGALLGTVVTDPTTGWETKDYQLSLNTPIRGKHTIYVKSKKGTCDFQSMSFLINEEGDQYPSLSADDGFYNAEDLKKQNKLGILYQLGLLSNEKEYNGDELITRREYIRILDMLYNEELADSDVSMFKDIAPDDKDIKAISNLCARKIIKGITDDKLMPDKFITVEEMLKMSVRVMGYSYAEDVGENTFKTASDADILSHVNTSNQTVRRDDMVEIIYNMLTGKVAKLSMTGPYNKEYERVKEGVLSITKDIDFAYGIVSDNGFTNIFDIDSRVKMGDVLIGDRVFNVNGTRAADYIGMNCLYFYSEDNGESDRIEAISPDTKVSYAVLSTKNTDFTDIKERQISYYDEKNREKDIDFNPSTSIVFNGKAIDKQLNELIPDISEFLGRIVAIDNDKDNKYDVVLIDSYISVVFGGMSENELYDKVTNTKLPIYDVDTALILSNGARVNWEDIHESAVIDIYQSANSSGKKAERLIVSTKVLEGNVSSKTNDKLIVNGEEYGIYHGLTDTPVVGQKFTLYLNTDDQVVRYVNETGDTKLGYIYNIKVFTADDGEDSCVVNMLSEENKDEKLFFAENATIDGVRIKGNNELVNGKNKFKGAGTLPAEKPVLYKTDDDGFITYFDTIRTAADNDHDVFKEILPEGAYNNKTIGLTENAKSLLVCAFAPEKKVIALWNTGEKELATIGTGLTSGSSQNITASAYTTKKDSILSDVILWKNSKVRDHQPDFVFDSISEKLNDDGETVKVLRGFTGNAKVEYPVNIFVMDAIAEGDITYERLIESLNPGDLLSVGINERGEAEEIKPILFSDGEPENSIGVKAAISKITATDTTYARGVTSHGTVLGVENGIIKFEKDNGGIKSVEYASCKNAKVIKIEKVSSKIKTTNNLDANSVMIGDHIVVSRNTATYSAAAIFLYQTIDW